jgi:hypothetical protein
LMSRYRIGRVGGRTVKVSRRHQASSGGPRGRVPRSGGPTSGDGPESRRDLLLGYALYGCVLAAVLWPTYLLFHLPVDWVVFLASFAAPMGLAVLIAIGMAFNSPAHKINQQVAIMVRAQKDGDWEAEAGAIRRYNELQEEMRRGSDTNGPR